MGLSRADLYAAWQGTDGFPPGKDRPQWVREHAADLNEHTDVSEPVPTGSNFEIRQWLDRYKGTVTRQLNDDADGSDPHDAEGE